MEKHKIEKMVADMDEETELTFMETIINKRIKRLRKEEE